MKKVNVLFAFLIILTCLNGCYLKKEEDIVIEDTIEKCESITEVNALLNTNIIDFEGEKENEDYTVNISTGTGICRFTIDDKEYTLSVSEYLMEDTLDIYKEDEKISKAGSPVFLIEKEYKASRFAYNNHQYAIKIVDNDLYTAAEFMNIVKDWLNKIAVDCDKKLRDLTGLYYEKESRGSLRVYPASSSTVYLSVSLPKDDDSYDTWIMEAELVEDMLIYGECEHYVNYLNTGELYNVEDTGEGHMSIYDGSLYWLANMQDSDTAYKFERK